jgi:ABC-type uncharacterized transport system
MALRGVLRLAVGRGGRIALGLALVLVNLVLINYVASRHFVRADWTSTRVHALSPKTVRLLEGLRRRVTITVFMAPPQRFEASLYHEVRELLQRFLSYAPQLRVETIDIDASPTRADLLSKRYGVNPTDLREGVIVVASGPRHRYVRAPALGAYELRGARQRLVAFRGEEALLEALLSVTTRAPATVCFTRDHGEAPTDSYQDAGYGHIFDEVKREAFKARVVGSRDLLAGAPGCTVLVIGGPRRAFAPVEIDALQRYLSGGGRAFILLGPVLDRRATRHQTTGLERLLRRWGVEVLDRIVVDKLAVPGEQPLMTWATRDGYNAQHPIGRAMAGKLTVWPLVREVRPLRVPGRDELVAVPLVRTSADGWAESDLASLRGARPLQFDAAVDSPGPVTAATAVTWGRGRLVVLGTERGVLNRRLGAAAVRDFNRDLFLTTLNWLAGRQQRVAAGPKPLEQLQLTLDDTQLGRVFLLSVVALPAVGLLLGLIVWRRRRA